MDKIKLDKWQAICDAATPGPWEWWLRPNHPVMLAHPGHGLLIVMDAVRDGMQGATVRFAKREGTKGGLLHKASDLHKPYNSRASEFIELDNPDAAFMTYARTAMPQLIARVRELKEKLQRYETGYNDVELDHD